MKMTKLYDSKIGSRAQKSEVAPQKGAVTKVVPYVNHYAKFSFDDSIEADIVVPPVLFTAMSEWFHEGAGREITGYGVLTPEGDLVWATYTDTGSAGFVTNSGDGAVQAMMAAMKAGHTYINLHWHTHPDMGPFYSGTDKEHHANRALSADIGDDMTYLVFDGAYWLVRRIVVTAHGGVCSYNDGAVFLGDSERPLPSAKYASKYQSWEGGLYGAQKKNNGKNNNKKKKKEDEKYDSYDDIEVVMCDDCIGEFGMQAGTGQGKIGDICWTCGDLITIADSDMPDIPDDGVSRLMTRKEVLREEAEEILDMYLDFIDAFQEQRAYDHLRKASGEECFPVIMQIISERPALSSSPEIMSHLKTICAVMDREVIQ
jgi:proteasome lid subunit RPN8/RPN11